MIKIYAILACILVFNFGKAQSITSFELLDTTNAGLVTYPKIGDYISYSKVRLDGFFDIYTMKLDGTNKYCWTCNSSLNRNNAHPEWHSSMKYIIFEGEKNSNNTYTHPDFGWYYDLWALRLSDDSLFLLRDPAAANAGYSLTGVLHPHFSHDGKKLIWGELKANSILNWQNYSIMAADFVEMPYPHLENVKTVFNPLFGLVEPQGLSYNNDKLLFAANLLPGQKPTTLDLYYIRLDDQYNKIGAPVAVSQSMNEWAEAAKFLPDDKIIFSTTKGYPIYPDSTENTFEWRKSEYWICDTLGGNLKQLSFFMDKNSIEYLTDHVDAADFDLSHDGTEGVVTLHANNKLYTAKITIDYGGTTAVKSEIQQSKKNLNLIYVSNNVIQLDLNSIDGEFGIISVYSANGEKLQLDCNVSSKKANINIDNLPYGVYIVNYQNSTFSASHKFVK